MLFACSVPKTTDTQAEYVTFIDFPLQQWLHERVSMSLYTYTACSVNHHVRTVITGLEGLKVRLCVTSWRIFCLPNRTIVYSKRKFL